MIPLTVILITKNEEHNIDECLRTVEWAGEIVIVDAQSSDTTIEKARKFTDKIFVEPWLGFAEAKTCAVSHSTYDWILWIDADERVSSALTSEIKSIVGNSFQRVAFSIPRRAYFLGRWINHSGWYPGRVIRLFNKHYAHFNSATVHEGLEVNGQIGSLHNDLLHYTDPNIFHYMTKFNRYTTLAVKELMSRKKRFRIIDLLVRPPWMFLKSYVFRLGFLDGTHGLLLALFSSFYVFTKYSKLWEEWQKEK